MDDYIEEQVLCGDCGSPMKLQKGPKGLYYVCIRYPECDGTHSAHTHTGLPMGIPANRETRAWRKKAHIAFDAYWVKRKLKRKEAYSLLSRTMNLPKELAHISMFDIEQCKQVIKLCLEGF